MNLITTSYFVGSINIPNTNKPEVKSALEHSINKYEQEALIKLMGYAEYKLLKDAIDDGEPYSAPYDDLINGTDYDIIVNGVTYQARWNGLINDEKISLLAYYIYYKYRRETVTSTTGIGEIIGTPENAENALLLNKTVNAYNSFVRLFGLLPLGFTQGTVYDLNFSAYNYLTTKQVEFPDWIYTRQTNINEFNI